MKKLILATTISILAACSSGTSDEVAVEPTTPTPVVTEAPTTEPPPAPPTTEVAAPVATEISAPPTTEYVRATIATTTTLAEPEMVQWGPGTFKLDDEIPYGFYRTVGYWALLDENLEIIDNDLSYDGMGMVPAFEPAVYLEIDSAVDLNDPAAPVIVNPILVGWTDGTYLAGSDVPYGRYRVSDPDYAYAACLTITNDGFDILDNEGGAGSILFDVTPDCFAVSYSGEIAAE